MRFVTLSLATLAFALAQPVWAETAAPPAAVIAPPRITVSTVETRNLRDVVLASGLIAPVEQVQVVPLVEGQQIEALLAEVGDRVAAGQVLARLSASSLTLQKTQLEASRAAARATIAQAEAQSVEAEASAAEAVRVAGRTKSLQEQGTASQAALDKANAAAISATSRVTVAVQSLEAARANLALAEAQLANIELQLSRTEVKAPVAGEITARTAQVGAVASAAGQPMFSLIRDGALELRADIAERDVLRLAAGQEVTLRLAGSDALRPGTVRLVEPTIDAATRMGRVRISIDMADGVRAGMFAEAEVLVTEHPALAVPITAIGQSDAGPVVLKVTEGTARLVAVTTGISDKGWIEIVTGLAAGDSIVAKAGAFVRDGEKITPVPAVTN